jgi:uncharacterized ParB-like nuclease family protein
VATARLLTEEDIAHLPVREDLEIRRVRTDGGTQSRAGLDSGWAAEIARLIREGVQFPPVVVFFDGESYWLASGFHRLEGHRQAKRGHVRARVVRGDLEDARLFSAGANRRHGLKRSNDDKQVAVCMVLESPRALGWTNVEVAEHCGVSEGMVRKLRREIKTGEVVVSYDGEEEDGPRPRPVKVGRRGLDARDLPKLRDQCKRSARKLWRQLQYLAGLTGKPFALLLANHMVYAERAERAADLKQGASDLEPADWGENGPPADAGPPAA